jgi:hypothetical protein
MNLIKSLLRSKKFIASLIGLAAGIAAHFGWQLDEASIMTMLSPILAYIVGQGMADLGKEKAKVERGEA